MGIVPRSTVASRKSTLDFGGERRNQRTIWRILLPLVKITYRQTLCVLQKFSTIRQVVFGTLDVSNDCSNQKSDCLKKKKKFKSIRLDLCTKKFQPSAYIKFNINIGATLLIGIT